MDGRDLLRCLRCNGASGSKQGAEPATVGGDRVSPLSNAISGRQATVRLARGRKHDGRSRTQCRGAAIPARDPAVAVCSGHGPVSQRPRGATPGQVQRRSTDPSPLQRWDRTAGASARAKNCLAMRTWRSTPAAASARAWRPDRRASEPRRRRLRRKVQCPRSRLRPTRSRASRQTKLRLNERAAGVPRTPFEFSSDGWVWFARSR